MSIDLYAKALIIAVLFRGLICSHLSIIIYKWGFGQMRLTRKKPSSTIINHICQTCTLWLLQTSNFSKAGCYIDRFLKDFPHLLSSQPQIRMFLVNHKYSKWPFAVDTSSITNFPISTTTIVFLQMWLSFPSSQ